MDLKGMPLILGAQLTLPGEIPGASCTFCRAVLAFSLISDAPLATHPAAMAVNVRTLGLIVILK